MCASILVLYAVVESRRCCDVMSATSLYASLPPSLSLSSRSKVPMHRGARDGVAEPDRADRLFADQDGRECKLNFAVLKIMPNRNGRRRVDARQLDAADDETAELLVDERERVAVEVCETLRVALVHVACLQRAGDSASETHCL